MKLSVSEPHKLLVTGASGLLGTSICRAFLKNEAYDVTGLHLTHGPALPGLRSEQLDLRDSKAVQSTFSRLRPDLVIHTAGLSNVDQCERDPHLAHGIHVEATSNLVEMVRATGSRLVHISTDHLFDGKLPFVTEKTPVSPLNVYGKTKARAEELALSTPDALVIRTNFYGSGLAWRSSFSDWLLSHLREGKELPLFEDIYFTPIAIEDMLGPLALLLEKNASGIFNLCGPERVSKLDFGRRFAKTMGFDNSRIRPIRVDSAKLLACRPKDMSLSTDKIVKFIGRALPGLEHGMRGLAAEGR